MNEVDGWQFDLEVHPSGWHFAPGTSWIAGWLWSTRNRLVVDLRAWIDGRPFLAIWGLPKPGLDERFLHRPGPPYLGFSLLVEPHPGASMLRLEVRDQTGRWQEIFQTTITVATGATPCPAPPSLADLLPSSIPTLLRLHRQRPVVPLAALADEVVSGALSVPLDSLPNPPFHGALEEPRAQGWIRYGRLSITGWLAHRHRTITRITAMVDPLQEGALLHGIERTDIDSVGSFADLPGRETSAFVGHVDLPADTSTPALLKVFAELDNGEKHLAFAQRFTPRIIAGAEAPLPPLSRTLFLKAALALRGAARRHGLPIDAWTTLQSSARAAWSAFANEAPSRRQLARLARVPAPGPTPPMRVLVVTHNLNFEGAPWFICELARHLKAHSGVSVRVVSPQEGPMRAIFVKAGIPVDVLDLATAMKAGSAGEFHDHLDAVVAGLPWAETDLVIANTMVSFWAVHAAKRRQKPALMYVHESAAIRRFFAPLLNEALFDVVESAFREATRVVFTADASRVVFDHLGGRGNFVLLPSWVDANRVDAFAAQTDRSFLRRKHGLDPDAVLVVNIGSLCERKGQHVFIRAADLLKSELAFTYPDRRIQFVMVGARPGLYLETLKEEIDRLDLADTVRFIPETGEIFDFYALADIFVCTSFEESFPRVLLESAAFRLPIVSTQVNGIPEMLEPDEAWLVPPGDRYRLAEAIKFALAACFSGDKSRTEKARLSVLRKYHESNALPLHVAVMRESLASIR